MLFSWVSNGVNSRILKKWMLSNLKAVLKRDRERAKTRDVSAPVLYLESSCDEMCRNHIPESVCVTSASSQRFPFKDNWMKELDSEVAGSSKDSQRIQPKLKTQLSRTGRPVSEQPSGSFTQEIGKDVLFGRVGTKNSRTGRPVDGPPSSQSCVPVSVEPSRIFFYRILTVRSYLLARMMSRTYEMFTAWVKSDPETILKRHVVDSKGISCLPWGTSQKAPSFFLWTSLRQWHAKSFSWAYKAKCL